MIITKVTPGFVAQRYNTETGQWLDQEFIASDQVDWEDENGEAIDIDEMEGDEPYLPFMMDMPCQHELDSDFYTLMDAYAERYMEDMPTECLEEICKDDLVSRLEKLTMEQLTEQVKEYYPELLEE